MAAAEPPVWKLKICCLGAGYVGGPTMAVIADNCPQIKVAKGKNDGNKMTCVTCACMCNFPRVRR